MSSSKAFRTYHGDSSQDSYRPRKEYERRRRHALKALAGIMLSHNTVDFRVVKRFRFWQVRIFKEKIIAFKRLLRSTNRNYLSSRLRVLERIFSAGVSATLARWRLKGTLVEVPEDVKPRLIAGKIGALIQHFQSKQRLYSHFRQPLGSRHTPITKSDWVIWSSCCKQRGFDLWLGKTYRPEPLLHRKYQLLLQVKVLVERRLMNRKSQAWKAVRKYTEFPLVVPMITTLKTVVFPVIRSGWERLRTVQMMPSSDLLRITAGVHALSSLSEQRICSRLEVLWSLEKWRSVRKTDDLKEIGKRMRRIGRMGVKRAFYEVVMWREREEKGEFEVDKNIIMNQAVLLVHLEKVLLRKTRETAALKRTYYLRVLRASLHSRLRSYMFHWSYSSADLSHEKDEIFSYVQQLEAGAGHRLVEGEEELSGSRFSDFESIRAKIGRRSADSAVLETD